MAASEAAAGATSYAAPEHALDPQIPSYLVWSVYQYAAVLCALFAVISVGAGHIFIPKLLDYVLASGIVFVPVAAVLGVRNTRRNIAAVRRLNPAVQAVHAHAVYCVDCACVFFDHRDLPGRLRAQVPMPVTHYRRRLWQACGYTRAL
jgi:hypothetical protein